VQYDDAAYSQRTARPAYLGITGPLMAVSVGDTIEVVLKVCRSMAILALIPANALNAWMKECMRHGWCPTEMPCDRAGMVQVTSQRLAVLMLDNAEQPWL
jgi:hypothetical protein